MLLRTRCAAVLAAVLLGAVACSGDDDGSPSGQPAPSNSVQEPIGTDDNGAPVTLPARVVTSPSDRVGCRVKVTGDIEEEFTGKDDDQAFASDHYFSEDEVDSILGRTSAEGQPSTLPGEEPDVTIPPRTAGSALVTAWFLLNCQGGDTTFSVYSNPESTKDDVPFSGKDYDVVPASLVNDPKAFLAFIVFGANPEPTVWAVGDGAKISVDRFDESGASGSFRVPMVEQLADVTATPREIVVEGGFDVTCKEGAHCTTS